MWMSGAQASQVRVADSLFDFVDATNVIGAVWAPGAFVPSSRARFSNLGAGTGPSEIASASMYGAVQTP